MSRDLVTISARVDADSDLAEQMEQYRSQNSMTSKSEAVRHLLRAGLEQELEQSDDVVDDSAASDAAEASDSAAASARQDQISLVDTHDPMLWGIVFLAVSIPSLPELAPFLGRLGVLGDLGMGMWAVLGFGITTAVFYDIVKRAENIPVLSARSDAENAAAGAE